MVVSIVNVTPNHGSRYYTQEGNRTDKEQQQASNWYGKLTKVLEVEGQVNSNALIHLLHGRTPTGELLLNKTRLHSWQQNARSKGEEIPLERAGIDLTTSAPKSISIQALVFGDSRLEEAHRQATEQMLSVLEDRYALTRLTKDKQRQKILTGQLAIAQFHHESRRALDPQLHTHNLILNLQQRPDGRWQSLDNEAIYRAKMLLGKIYRNELALQIQALGYGIQVTNSRHGLWELDGFSSSQMGQFSKRAQQIETVAGADASSRKKAWITFTSGRQEKQSVPWSTLVKRWQQEALQSEIEPIQTAQAIQPTSLMPQTAVQAAIDQITEPVFRREEIEHLALLPPGQTSITAIDAAIDHHPSLILCSNTQGQRRYTKGVHDVLPEMRERAKYQPPTLLKQPSATAAPNSANPPTQPTTPTPLFVSATNSGQLSPTSSTEPLEDIWQEWKSEQLNLATASQIEELNRWVKPIPRAMFLLRRKLEDQSRRLEAMDVHLMTVLQEIEASTEIVQPNRSNLLQQNQARSQPMTTGNWNALGIKALEVFLTVGVTVLLLQISLPLWFRVSSPQQFPVEQQKGGK